MALLKMDPFKNYASLLSRGWVASIASRDGIPAYLGGTGRFGGTALVSDNGQYGCQIGIPASQTVVVGVALLFGGSTPTQTNVLGLHYGSVNPQIVIRYLSTGEIVVYRGPGIAYGTELGRSASGAFPLGAWHYLEIKAKIDGSTGTVEVRVNGATKLSLTGQNTYYTTSPVVTAIALNCLNQGFNNQSVWYSDFYACDTSGLTNNDFLGDCRVESLASSGAGAETQWTPLSGSNYANAQTADGDTSYNKSNTVGQVDTYAMDDLSSVTGVIYGVQYLLYARKDNAGSRTVAPVARIGGTDYAGADENLGTSYAYAPEIKEKSPATSAAWTISEVNAMEYGVKVTG